MGAVELRMGASGKGESYDPGADELAQIRAEVRASLERQQGGPSPESDARLLSRLLFEARELIDMYADVVSRSSGTPDAWSTRVRDEIDAYRANRGWNPNGYGRE